jgi:cytochrome P450
MPAALKKLSEKIETEADALVERLVGLGQFDAVQDLAWHLPLTVVTDLVGVPRSYGERLIEFAEIMFDWAGPPGCPITDAAVKRVPGTQELIGHLTDRRNLRPGSMGMAIFEAADRGDIEDWRAPLLMMDYLGPSLDTTIAGTGNAIWLFANNQRQWDLLRDDPTRVGAAVDEVLRLESPIQYFSRVANSDQTIDGTDIAAGDRLLVMYGSANRDSAKWPSADSMDINRSGLGGQVAFGAGVHSCAGRNLAKAEITALLRALLKRVKAFRITDAQRRQAYIMRSFARLEVKTEH